MVHPFVQAGAKKMPELVVGAASPPLAGNYLWFFTGVPPVDAYAAHFARDPYYTIVPEIVAGADPSSSAPSAMREYAVLGTVAACIVGAMILGKK
jgi:hypothetical protein